ncbi:MAG: InlB B-repeat-containing protein [Bifidobacterium sp.]|nr:InlB B-repeat-containing protein [Bifidobacterium sp.]
MFKGVAAALVAPAMLVGLAGPSASANTQTNEKATTQSQSVQADTDKKADWPIEAPSKGESGNGSATSGTVPVSPQKPKSGSGETAQGSVGARDAVPCTEKANQTWGTLHWNIHLSDDQQDCVLELESGTIPDTGTIGDDGSNPINSQYKSTQVTRLVVDENAGDPVKLTSGWGIFDNYFLPNLKTADVGNLDTSSASHIGYMFHDLAHLTTVTGINKWDTSTVVDMNHMFLNDSALVGDVDRSPQAAPNGRSFDLSHWKTAKVKDMTSMFQGCSSLQSLDISGFDMSGLTWLWYGNGSGNSYPARLRSYFCMFQGTTSLKRLKLGSGAHIAPGKTNNDPAGQWSVYGHQDMPSYYCQAYPFSDDCIPTTPRYESVDQKAKMPGWQGIDPGPVGLDGKGEWLYLTTAQYNGNGSSSSVTGCGDGYAVPNAAICTAATRPGYRFKGWNTQANMQGTDYPLKDVNGNVSVIPYDMGDVTLYARWSDKPQPTITAHTVNTDGVHLTGSIAGTVHNGDKLTVSDNGKQSSGEVALTDSETTWSAVVPLPKDTVGKGGDVTYTAKITRGSDEDADDSEPYETKVDAVAPGFEDLKVDSSAGTLKGTVWSSGDKKTQSDRTTESGDTVDITWPDGTTSTVTSGTDGKFSVDVPASVPMRGKAKVKATDTAGTNGIEGRNNVSASVDVKMLNPVHFDVGSGEVSDVPVDQGVKDGGHATKPTPDPSKTGYRFDGWYTDDTYDTEFNFSDMAINADTTIVAKWVRIYKVRFEANGGSAVDDQVKDAGKSPDKPADPTRAGHRFLGWYTATTGGDEFSFSQALTGDVTAYAHWVVTHKVTFDANGGGAVKTPVTVDDGKKVPDPGTPSPAPNDGDGNPSVFRGWYNGKAKYDFNDAVTGDLKLKAKWAAANHTVTFDAQGGSGAPDAVGVADGGKAARPAAGKNLTRGGYRFDNWYTDATGSTKFDFDTTEITEDTTVYAHWIKTYVVTFNSAGGSDVARKRWIRVARRPIRARRPRCLVIRMASRPSSLAGTTAT